MPSESPFSRHGAPLSSPTPPLIRRALTDAHYETPYHLAHRMVGEWRRWRELLEASGITTPFDLAGPRWSAGLEAYSYPSAGSDLFDGIAARFLWCSSLWPDTFRIVVAPSGPDWTVTPYLPDGTGGWNAGIPSTVLSGSPIQPRVFAFYGATSQMESLELEMTDAVWDVLRTSGDTRIKLNLRPARSEVVMPRRSLGLGRGE